VREAAGFFSDGWWVCWVLERAWAGCGNKYGC